MSTPSASPGEHAPSAHMRPGWTGWLTWLGLLAVLLAVFGMYLQPDFLLTLADQLWSCL